MNRSVAVLSTLLAILAAAQTAEGGRIPTQTKRQAEVNLLRAIPNKAKTWRMPGLIDAGTRLLADNTEAVCHGRGARHVGNRYVRFVCVVRPHVHKGRQGLYVTYRVVPRNRFEISFLAFRNR